MTDYETPEMPDTCYCSSNGECQVCQDLLELLEQLETEK